jgi:hypothetical protein
MSDLFCFQVFVECHGAHLSSQPVHPLDLPNDLAPDQFDDADFELLDEKEKKEVFLAGWSSKSRT